jgi:hypothetical protein
VDGQLAAADIPRPADPRTGVRLHLLGDFPATAVTATSPIPGGAVPDRDGARRPGRSSLILRRTSGQGETLRSCFVTLLEPEGPASPPLRRVGRVESTPDAVAVRVETANGPEHLLVNLEPGSTCRVRLSNGKYAAFDGLALRVRDDGLALAGGTFAEGSGRLASQPRRAGTIQEARREPSPRGGGWFLTAQPLEADAALAGRILFIEHGDGSRRAWTLDSLEPVPGGTRLHVREEPGFLIDDGGAAVYYQFPQVSAPGPHRFSLAGIARR